MDQLGEMQKAAVKKSSSDRLRLYLLKSGYEEETVLGWSREELMERYAELLLKGVDPEGAAQALDPVAVEERERWQHEQRMKEMELEVERMKLQAANAAREVELQRLALEKTRVESDKELRFHEIKIKEAAEFDESAQLKRYGQALMHILSPQPDEVTDVPSWFRGVEDQFEKLKVPSVFRARLLHKYLSPRSRTLCARLDPQVRDDYAKMKEALLKDLGLSAKIFLEKFNCVRKVTSDTFMLHASKLESLLRQYLNARKVDDDFDKLVNLLISDRIKSELSEPCLKHIISLESSLSEGKWLSPTRLATVVDEYVSNLGSAFRATSSFLGQTSEVHRPSSAKDVSGKSDKTQSQLERRTNWSSDSSKARFGSVNSKMGNGRACFLCGSHFHLKANCDKKHINFAKRVNFTSAQHSQSEQGQRSDVVPPTQARVNKVCVESCVNSHLSEFEEIFGMFEHTDDLSDVKSVKCSDGIEVAQARPSVQFNTHRIIADTNAALHYVKLQVSDAVGNHVDITSLFDSGTETSILRNDAVSNLQCRSLGNVTLKAFDGHRTEGTLVSLDVKLSNAQRTVPVNFVVCDKVSHACLLSLSDYRRLLEQSTGCDDNPDEMFVPAHNDELDHTNIDAVLPCDDVTSSDSQSANNADVSDAVDNYDDDDSIDIIENDNDQVLGSDAVPVDALQDLINPQAAGVDKLAEEQKADETLSGAYRLASENKGGYFVRNKLLFHRTQLLGNNVDRLVVPSGRREAILDLAHNVGGHMGVRRTKDRIALSFTWPNLINDVIKYCRSCEICQKRARVTCKDRVPIEGGVVSVEPVFSHFYVDCLGPLCSYSIQYNYAIVFLDKVSRYPHCVPLRSITAKSCCEAMLSFWQFTGIPTKVTMDRATNFTGELTREFLKRVGVSPIFCTPRHPEANSVERTVGTIKSMIAKVAEEHPRSWQRYVDLILWAIRESPNETNNVSPYTLVFGHLPHGPLAVLRDIWINENKYPVPKNKSTADFLKDLRDRLNIARSYAESHAEKSQQRYVDRYNRHSRQKSFTVGESVLVLQKDSTASKVFSRWIGPVVVTEVQSPHSYVVEFDDGSRRIIHANHLRKFHTRTQAVQYDTMLLTSGCDVNSCALISDQDQDFGEICVIDTPSDDQCSKPLPSQLIDRETLSHLSVKQQGELLQLLDKYADCFSEMPGLTTRVEHTLELTPNFKPKCMREYKVPECLKAEVERQLKGMLANGIITESTSSMCSPLVLVKKGKTFSDGIRLAVDYRYLNSFTVSDAFPIPDIEDVIQRVGSKRYISVFDCRQGYWQTSVRKSDRWLTAFVCLGRLYEFTRTAFGMKNAGQTFVRAMHQILQPLCEFVDSFIDDCAVFSDLWHEHLSHLESYLSTMKREGITLNLNKSQFAQPKIYFCGEVIGSGTRGLDPTKVSAVKDMAIPETKKQLRRILGFFSYFRKHIPAFADKAKILTDLTAKRVPQKLESQWNAKHSEALEILKQELIKACETPLHTVRFDKPFQIYVDASQDACGGLICWLDDEGTDHPIAFFSTKFTPTQKNWSTIEREAFAVLTAVKKYRHWICGAKVIIYSDHNPLTFLVSAAPKSSKLMRWSLALAEFDLEFRFRAGKQNVAADALSRPGPVELTG